MSVEFDFFLAIRAARELDYHEFVLTQVREASKAGEQPLPSHEQRSSAEPQGLQTGTKARRWNTIYRCYAGICEKITGVEQSKDQ
ncbi:hypothetical protein [Mesorhizobium sp. M0895]|uniref:hypothetical protein n=1 Tax=Mesorhizobium sp. M0895 TaxID=2957019 RepID=UPI003336C4BE